LPVVLFFGLLAVLLAVFLAAFFAELPEHCAACVAHPRRAGARGRFAIAKLQMLVLGK
jgi:hypothetical protein